MFLKLAQIMPRLRTPKDLENPIALRRLCLADTLNVLESLIYSILYFVIL